MCTTVGSPTVKWVGLVQTPPATTTAFFRVFCVPGGNV